MNGKQPFEPVMACVNSLLCPFDLQMLLQPANALSMIRLENSWTFFVFANLTTA